MVTQSHQQGQANLQSATRNPTVPPTLVELDLAIAKKQLAIELADGPEADILVGEIFKLYRQRLELRGAA